MDSDCGPHRQGRVDCVDGLEIQEFLARNRSLLIYKARFSGQPVLAYEYAPLGLVVREPDSQLVAASAAAQAPLRAARIAWRQGMLACDSAAMAKAGGMAFVQPRSQAQGASHWWIGAFSAQAWTVPALPGNFPGQAALATQLAQAVNAVGDSLVLHGNINPWAFAAMDGGTLCITACLPDERGFLRLLDGNDSLWQPGYSPPEMADGAQRLPLGPWTDVFGLSALMFHAITKAPPPDWTRAGDPDNWRARLSADLDGLCLPRVQKVIISGLSLDSAERPSSASEWHGLMDIGPLEGESPRPVELAKPAAASAPAASYTGPREKVAAPPPERVPSPDDGGKGFGLRHAILGLALLGGAGWAASGLIAPADEPATAGQTEAVVAKDAEEATPDLVIQPDVVVDARPAKAADDAEAEAEAMADAVRDVAEPAPARAAPPPPAVIIAPSRPTPQPARTTPRVVASPAPRPVAQPVPRAPAPVVSGYDSESETTRRLNAQQAAAARRQNEQNRAAAEAERRARADRERKIAAEQEAYRQRQAATEAERLRREREHQANMARWRADVAACNAGDRTRCAK